MGTASKIIKTVAPLVPRHYVVMEVKGNLIEAERAANLKKFPSRLFKKTACVMMGEPIAAHKELVKNKLLKVKQQKLDAQFKQKKAEKERKKLIAQKQKEAGADAEEKKEEAEVKEEEKKEETKEEE